MGLTFEHFAETNSVRKDRWHKDGDEWTGADWSNAMAGECGEACNVVKKLRRQETGLTNSYDPEYIKLLEMLGEEIADTITYAFLVADHYGIDVEWAVVDKFNKVSEKNGFPEVL